MKSGGMQIAKKKKIFYFYLLHYPILGSGGVQIVEMENIVRKSREFNSLIFCKKFSLV